MVSECMQEGDFWASYRLAVSGLSASPRLSLKRHTGKQCCPRSAVIGMKDSRFKCCIERLTATVDSNKCVMVNR